MTIEIKIPADALALQYHIGQALKLAAIDAGFNVNPTLLTPVMGRTTVATAGEDIIAGQPVVLKKGEASASVNEKFTPPEAEFTAEEAKEVIGNADENPLKDTLSPDTPDADGIVWDKRIHSKGQTRNADDTWRLARKPKDKTEAEWNEYVEAVKAELLAVAAAEDNVHDPMSVDVETGEVFTDPVPPVTETVADPVPPVTETVADPVPPVTETVADPVPPVTETVADPVPPVTAQVDEQLTFAKVIAFATANKSKLPPMEELNKVYADLAASMDIPVTTANAPIVAFAKAGPNVLSTLKATIEGLING